MNVHLQCCANVEEILFSFKGGNIFLWYLSPILSLHRDVMSKKREGCVFQLGFFQNCQDFVVVFESNPYGSCTSEEECQSVLFYI